MQYWQEHEKSPTGLQFGKVKYLNIGLYWCVLGKNNVHDRGTVTTTSAFGVHTGIQSLGFTTLLFTKPHELHVVMCKKYISGWCTNSLTV